MPTPTQTGPDAPTRSRFTLRPRPVTAAVSPGSAGKLAPLAAYFFLAGFVLSNWAVRIPEVKDQVGASARDLGFALLCQSIGGLISMAVGSRLCIRFGTLKTNIAFGTLTCLCVVIPSHTGSPLALGVSLAGLGLAYGTFNIALNSAAVEVESATGRSIMSNLHGLFSAGSLAGALIGGLAAARLTPSAHVLLVASVGLAVIAGFARPLLSRTPQPSSSRTEKITNEGARPGKVKTKLAAKVPRFTYVFAIIAFCTAFGEFTAVDWATLHLRADLTASATTAAWGLACYELAMTIGRLAGGRLIQRFGETVVLGGGAVLALTGGLVSSWAGSLPGGIIVAYLGYLLLGLGMANVFPIAIARSGSIGGPVAVSRTAMAGSIGIMVERPVIGSVADQVGLPGALSLVAILIALIAALGVVAGRRAQPSDQHPAQEPVTQR